MTGHVAEIFDYMSAEPIINEREINNSSRPMQVVSLDSYGLFDKKKGDWRIIEHEEEYVPKDVEGIYFTYGVASSCKKWIFLVIISHQ